MKPVLAQWSAQLLGVFGMTSLFFMYRQTARKNYLRLKLLSDILWAIHYLLLSAPGGAIPNLVGIVRELVLMYNRKCQTRIHFWAALFITVNAVLALSTLRSAVQLIPIFASMLVTVSLTMSKTSSIRLMSIPISIAFLIYDLLVGSWAGVLNETFSLISMISKSVSEHRAS